jgi:hypothetical protein
MPLRVKQVVLVHTFVFMVEARSNRNPFSFRLAQFMPLPAFVAQEIAQHDSTLSITQAIQTNMSFTSSACLVHTPHSRLGVHRRTGR